MPTGWFALSDSRRMLQAPAFADRSVGAIVHSEPKRGVAMERLVLSVQEVSAMRVESGLKAGLGSSVSPEG